MWLYLEWHNYAQIIYQRSNQAAHGNSKVHRKCGRHRKHVPEHAVAGGDPNKTFSSSCKTLVWKTNNAHNPKHNIPTWSIVVVASYYGDAFLKQVQGNCNNNFGIHLPAEQQP